MYLHSPNTNHETHTERAPRPQKKEGKQTGAMTEAGACQTRNMGSYEDEEEEEKQAAPLDEVKGCWVLVVVYRGRLWTDWVGGRCHAVEPHDHTATRPAH